MYTEKEKKAIELHPDLPSEMAAAFADDLLEIQEEIDLIIKRENSVQIQAKEDSSCG